MNIVLYEKLRKCPLDENLSCMSILIFSVVLEWRMKYYDMCSRVIDGCCLPVELTCMFLSYELCVSVFD